MFPPLKSRAYRYPPHFLLSLSLSRGFRGLIELSSGQRALSELKTKLKIEEAILFRPVVSLAVWRGVEHWLNN
jgi:hypothetical protein